MTSSRMRDPSTPSEILYSAYRFLTLDELFRLPEQDVQFLELNGCLHLPTRSVQDELVHQYFLYVHPCFPCIDEAEFWDLYLNRDQHDGTRKTMSLLVFQGMLFASSAFVSPAVLKYAGYSGVKAARSMFYRRAKFLFDFGVEIDAFTKAQAAMLLTFQFTAAEPHAGSLWLSVAIQNAVVAQAHTFQGQASNKALQRRNKRLWWSLYWRDRVVSLGLRKPLQITPFNYNARLDSLTRRDMREEACQSAVYDPRTKRHLAEILDFQCQLAVILTEVLALSYGPTAFDPTYSLDQFDGTLSRIQAVRSELSRWKADAEVAFSEFLADSNAHRSLTLFSSLIYIYFHAAQIALGHHEALIIERLQKGVTVFDESRLKSIGQELSNATKKTTGLVRHIVQKGLTQHLPISVIAYIAFPLMLGSLDEKLTPTAPQGASGQTLSRCHAQAMNLCNQRFEGAGDISKMINQILQSTPITLAIRSAETSNNQGHQATFATPPMPRGAVWDEIFVARSRLYLRLRISLDHALATGKPPRESDLPSYILEGGTKRLSLGPVHGLSAVTPGTADNLHMPRYFTNQLMDGESRVTEIEDTETSTADDNMGFCQVRRDIDLDGANLDNLSTTGQILVGRYNNHGGVHPGSWEYDPVLAGHLFEEMTDVLRG